MATVAKTAIPQVWPELGKSEQDLFLGEMRQAKDL